MDDELSSLKLKFYLFSFADTEQQQDQQQLTVENKKVGVLEDIRPTHLVRLSEVKQSCQRSASKQATLKNRELQRRSKQAHRNGNER